MNWIGRWLSGRASLPAAAKERLEAWRALPEPDLAAAALEGRYAVVDVESSGLNVRSDRLIAIGAVVIEASRIPLDAGFSVVLRQESASDDANILVHRIGGSAQIDGAEPVEALLDFLDYIGKSPLAGYHSPFDEIMIAKASRRYLGEPFRRSWIDLAYLAPALCTDMAAKTVGLDAWVGAFGITNAARHNALADALATAQLLLALCDRAAEQGIRTQLNLKKLADSQGWLERSRR